MAHPSRFALACLVSLLAACGGKAFEVGDPDPEPKGGTNQGGQGGSGSVAGTSSGGSAKGGSASAGSGQGGGSGGSLCQSFDDDAAQYIQVAIINKASTPIHLGQQMVDCTTPPPFSVLDAAGKLLPDLGGCRSSCELVREQGPVGCPAICAYPTAISLQPGEAFYTEYDGLYAAYMELPAECVSAQGQASCDRAAAIQPGTFTFFSQAGTSLDCSQTSGMATCGPCTPTGSGGCSTPGSLIGGATLKATTRVYLDESYGVYGRPAPAPLPLPGGEDPGSGVMALATVELVFTDVDLPDEPTP